MNVPRDILTPAERPYFAQGVRCGHLEGKGRAGHYVSGEEYAPSHDAADCNAPAPRRAVWSNGYRYGYRLAASGEPMPAWCESEALP